LTFSRFPVSILIFPKAFLLLSRRLCRAVEGSAEAAAAADRGASVGLAAAEAVKRERPRRHGEVGLIERRDNDDLGRERVSNTILTDLI
jgi:hypothetical protein